MDRVGEWGGFSFPYDFLYFNTPTRFYIIFNYYATMPSTVHTTVKVVLWPNCPTFGTACFGGADAHGRKVNPASTYAVLTLLLLPPATGTVVHAVTTTCCDYRRTSTVHTFVHHSNHPGIRPSACSLARPPARPLTRMHVHDYIHTRTHGHACTRTRSY